MSYPVCPDYLKMKPRVDVKAFVSSALKLTAPLSLSYPSSNHRTITNHFCDLHELFPSIHPIIKTEVDSVEEKLRNYLEASGVLPFLTKNKNLTYHVPISIFLPTSYPLCAPSVVIIPNTHMFVNPSNPHVDHFGRVTIPYTRDWNPSSSSLNGLCTSLSTLFSENTPVFIKKLPPGMPLWTSKAKKQCPVLCPLSCAPLPVASDDKDEAIQKVIKFLDENVEKDIEKIRESEDKANIMGLRTTLREHISRVWKVICGEEGPGREEELELEYQKKMRQSADSAVERVVEKLYEAVEGGKIPLNRYLSAIRIISRDQFYHRAYKKKIEELLDEARKSFQMRLQSQDR